MSRIAVLIAVFTLLTGGLFAQAAASKPPAATKAPQPGDELVIPIRTQIPVELTSAISSRTAYVGEPIYCQTVFPITVDNVIVIPVGAYVKGVVTQVVRPGHVRGKAQLGLRFDSVTLPGGFTKSFDGTLAGFAGNGKNSFNRKESKIQGQGTKGKDAETVAITGAEGAGIGSVAGISGRHSGEGAVIGGASGAMGGLIYVLASRGKEIVLPAGTDLQLQLTRPLVFYRYQVEPLPTEDPSGPAFPKRDPGPA
ncbi:MAG: hypothetical protein ACRD1N_04675 [Terriglobia bacterium]